MPNIYILIYKPPIYFELIQLQRTVSYAIQKAKADLIPNGPDTSDWGKVNQTLTCSIFYFISRKTDDLDKRDVEETLDGFQIAG